jgi:hypothetical protein
MVCWLSTRVLRIIRLHPCLLHVAAACMGTSKLLHWCNLTVVSMLHIVLIMAYGSLFLHAHDCMAMQLDEEGHGVIVWMILAAIMTDHFEDAVLAVQIPCWQAVRECSCKPVTSTLWLLSVYEKVV